MNYDAVIIGGGPGGYEAALWVARLGGRAVVIEKGELGGVCTNRGCIPTKSLIASCGVYDSLTRAGEFGIDAAAPKLNMDSLFKRRDRVALTMRKSVEKLLDDAKVDVVRGEGMIISDTEVEAGGGTVEGKNLVIATGSQPLGLPGIEIDHEYVMSGDDAAVASKLPKNAVIVGGGYIGCEYASIYSRLGSNVTLVEILPRILSSEDEDVSSAMERELSKRVNVLAGTKADSVDKKDGIVRAGGRDLPADSVILAVGRMPLMPDGLDGVGVAHDREGIKVDSRMRTNVGNIYAVGDVSSRLKLAHVAYAGAEVAAKNIMGADCQADYSAVPSCIYTMPEVARVGLRGQDAPPDSRVGTAEYVANGKARCMGERTGFCKVIADGKTGVILGVHIMGAHASDLIGEAALAVKNRLTVRQLIDTIHPHPTLTELIREACLKIRP